MPWSASTATRPTTTANARSPNVDEVHATAATYAAPFELVEADLRHTDIGALLDGVDVVFHQAAQPGVRLSWADGFATYTGLNVLATQRLLEAVQRDRQGAPPEGGLRLELVGVRQPAALPDGRDRCAGTAFARTASRSSRPSISAASTPRTTASKRCRSATSPCSVRASGPTCRSIACAPRP